MKIFTPNTIISSADINLNFDTINSNFGLIGSRQNITTNVALTDQLIQFGWSYVNGAGGVDYTNSIAITFPVAFDVGVVPIVTATCSGQEASVPTVFGANTVNMDRLHVAVGGVSNTGFTIRIGNNSGYAMATNQYFPFSWIAIGTKAR